MQRACRSSWSPKPLAAEPDEGRDQSFDQRRSYSRSGGYGIERNQLGVLSKEPISGQPFALPTGQRGQVGRLDHFAMHHDEISRPPIVEELGDPIAVRRTRRPN